MMFHNQSQFLAGCGFTVTVSWDAPMRFQAKAPGSEAGRDKARACGKCLESASFATIQAIEEYRFAVPGP
jgi:hypothetical protein